MKRSFARGFDELARVFEFTGQFFDAHRVPAEHRTAVDFAIEEIFTNMVKYHPQASGAIDVELQREQRRVRVVLTDHDVEPFDVTTVEPPDTEAPIHERRVGGLGLHLTKQMMTTVRYEYVDRTSRIIMTRELE